MSFAILRPQLVNVDAFIAFWNEQYSGYDEDFYLANVGQPLTEERIEKWFEWKNGSILSAGKAKSILSYASPNERIAPGASVAELRIFLNRSGGAIWRIFWLHIQHPNHFPIYDMHVHRGMAALRGWPDREIPNNNRRKVNQYLDEYRPFFHQFAHLPHRDVDRALWAFGKFLRSDYAGIMLGVPAIATGTSQNSDAIGD